MKALSIYQPWASLILGRKKMYETRGYKTDYRGRMLICSSRMDNPDLRTICKQHLFKAALEELGFDNPEKLPRGFLLGSVELVGCFPVHDMPSITKRELAFGDFMKGRFAWALARPIVLVVPLPFAGKQGLFSVDPIDVPEELK